MDSAAEMYDDPAAMAPGNDKAKDEAKDKAKDKKKKDGARDKAPGKDKAKDKENKDGAKDKAEKDKPKETDKPGAKDKAKEPKAKATLLGLQSMTGSAGGGDCTPTFTCGSSGTDECPCPGAGRMPGMMDDIMGSADAGDFEGVMAGCVDDEAAFAEECKKYDDCPEDATCAKAAAAGECFNHDGHLAAICCMSCAGTMMDSAAEMYDDPAAMAPGNDKAKDEEKKDGARDKAPGKDKAKDKENKDGAKDEAE